MASNVSAHIDRKTDEVAAKAGKALGKAAVWVDTELTPAIGKAAREVGEEVKGRGSVLARQAGAAIIKHAVDEDTLRSEREKDLATFNREFAYTLKAKPILPIFLTSAAACIHNFDSTGTPVQGVAVFPRQEILKNLKNDFLPLRIFLSRSGLMARTYAEKPSTSRSDTPAYVMTEERPAKVRDLIDLNISLRELLDTLQALRNDSRVKNFKETRRR